MYIYFNPKTLSNLPPTFSYNPIVTQFHNNLSDLFVRDLEVMKREEFKAST